MQWRGILIAKAFILIKYTVSHQSISFGHSYPEATLLCPAVLGSVWCFFTVDAYLYSLPCVLESIWGKLCVGLSLLLDLFCTRLLGDNNNEYESRWQGFKWETRILKQNKYEFQRITLIHSLYNCNCRLDFSLQKRLRRDRLYKNTPNSGYKGLEMRLSSIQAEPFKNSQPTYFFFSSFFWPKESFCMLRRSRNYHLGNCDL